MISDTHVYWNISNTQLPTSSSYPIKFLGKTLVFGREWWESAEADSGAGDPWSCCWVTKALSLVSDKVRHPVEVSISGACFSVITFTWLAVVKMASILWVGAKEFKLT